MSKKRIYFKTQTNKIIKLLCEIKQIQILGLTSAKLVSDKHCIPPHNIFDKRTSYKLLLSFVQVRCI
jgi:hypothetical protein